MTEPLFDPEDREAQSHDSLLSTVQLVFEIMLNVLLLLLLPPSKFIEDSDTVNTGTNSSCVTLTVSVFPPAVIVIVPVRGDAEVLDAATTVIVRIFAPEVGDTVNQVASPLLMV